MRFSDALLRFRTAGIEALSYARQATLLHLDTDRPVLPEDASPGDDVVVLVHGLFATAGVLRPLRKSIGRLKGVHTATFTYAPGPDVEGLCQTLGEVVSRLPERVRLHLVGHSLGGIIARAFAHQQTSLDVVQTISLAAPFAGVPGASALSFGSARDLDPQSPLLRRLRIDASSSEIAHFSILGGADNVVRPPLAHALPGHEVKVLEGCGHNALLFDERAAQLVKVRVAERLRARDK